MTALATLTDDPITLDLVLIDQKALGLFVRRDDQTNEQGAWFRWSEMVAHEIAPGRARVTALASKMRMRGLL